VALYIEINNGVLFINLCSYWKTDIPIYFHACSYQFFLGDSTIQFNRAFHTNILILVIFFSNRVHCLGLFSNVVHRFNCIINHIFQTSNLISRIHIFVSRRTCTMCSILMLLVAQIKIMSWVGSTRCNAQIYE